MEQATPTRSARELSDVERFRIEILLHEYDTLREEIIARTGYGFELLAIGAAVGAWLATTESAPWRRFWIIMSIVVFGVAIFVNLRDIIKASERLKEIESEIDKRTDEWYLLQHERLSGGLRILRKLVKRSVVPSRPTSVSERNRP